MQEEKVKKIWKKKREKARKRGNEVKKKKEERIRVKKKEKKNRSEEERKEVKKKGRRNSEPSRVVSSPFVQNLPIFQLILFYLYLACRLMLPAPINNIKIKVQLSVHTKHKKKCILKFEFKITSAF